MKIPIVETWKIEISIVKVHLLLVYVLVPRFGRLINGSIYEPLNGNELLFTNETLFCAPETNTYYIYWKYIPRQDLSAIDMGPYAALDTTLQYSILQVNTTQPGYYTCEITNAGSTKTYKVGVYDKTQHTGRLFLTRFLQFRTTLMGLV